MGHVVVIVAHTACGAVALVAGLVALWRRRLFVVHLVAMIATVVFLALAIAGDWAGLGTAERVLFAVFMVLALVMIGLAARAVRLRDRDTAGAPPPYADHLGFNVIALFDAFVVILVLDLGAPMWLIVAVAVAVAVAGHFTVTRNRKRLTAGRRLPA